MNLKLITNNARGLGVLAITVSVVLAILQGFQTSGALGANGTAPNTTASAAYQGVTTFISAIDDFATWASILVLGIVGFFLLKYVNQNSK